MYLNQFSVRIPEGNEKSSGYVEIDHGQRYTLVLRNARSVRCDAKVEIDGNVIGTFRIPKRDTITLERGLDNDGFLTFVAIDSPEAKIGGLQNNDDLGLVRVTFTPEVEWHPTGQVKGLEREELTSWFEKCALSANPQMNNLRGSRAGGTVSTGHSNQSFTSVGRITPDYTQQTTINLRLIQRQNAVRPLTQRENPVPPRL